MPRWRQKCVACGAATQEGAWLCPGHADIVEGKYVAENPLTVRAYVGAGIAAIEAAHASHALFDQYLHAKEEEAMSCIVKVKTPSGAVIPGIRDLEDPSWVTVFPGPHKDDGYLQGPAVPVQVSEGQPFEIVS